MPPRGSALGMSNQQETQDRPRLDCNDYVSWLAWEHIGVLPEELEQALGEWEVWAFWLRQLARDTDSDNRWMDGSKENSLNRKDEMCICF